MQDNAPPSRPSLSVIVLTQDEAHNIAECLDSVSCADEIIVFDSGSTDATVEICKRYTPHVYVAEWPGIGIQRNRALDKANGDWVLSMDADERVTPELAEEILAVLPDTQAAGFDLPFRSTYLGRFIRYGAWSGEHHQRLFRRAAGRFSTDIVHEHLIVQGAVETLNNCIVHHPFPDLAKMLDKLNLYSTEGARLRYARGKRTSLLEAILRGTWTFLKDYILRRGFLDGREGFLLALSNALGCFYRYVKLLYLQEAARRGEG